MSRLFQAGWETSLIEQLGAVSSTGLGGLGTATVVSATPVARSGTYCLRCGLTSNSNATGYARLSVTHASKTELYCALALYRHNAADAAFAPGTAFLHLNDVAGNVNTVICCESDGTIRAYYVAAGGTAPSSANLTLIGASTIGVAADTWTLVEVRAIAATGATGTLQIRVGGVSGLSASSQRTAQTNANFGATVVEYWRLQASSVTAGYFAVDDLRVNDTVGSVNISWPGDESIRLMVPNAAGDLTQLARGGTDSGANWSQVDEVPPTGSTDYVSSDTVGQTDLYNLSTVAVASVSAVEVIVQGFNAGGGGSIYLPTKTGAGQSDGTGQALTATPTILKRLLELDPADSAAWTAAKIDALQTGCKVAS